MKTCMNMYEHLELYPNGVNFTIDLAVVQAGVPACVPASASNVPVVSDPTIWTVGETVT